MVVNEFEALKKSEKQIFRKRTSCTTLKGFVGGSSCPEIHVFRSLGGFLNTTWTLDGNLKKCVGKISRFGGRLKISIQFHSSNPRFVHPGW